MSKARCGEKGEGRGGGKEGIGGEKREGSGGGRSGGKWDRGENEG